MRTGMDMAKEITDIVKEIPQDQKDVYIYYILGAVAGLMVLQLAYFIRMDRARTKDLKDMEDKLD